MGRRRTRTLRQDLHLFSTHFLQSSSRPICCSRPEGEVTQGRNSQGGRCLTCCVWPHERSATQSPDSSWWKPTIVAFIREF